MTFLGETVSDLFIYTSGWFSYFAREYCDDYVCLRVCLFVREDISWTTRVIFAKFSCMLPMSVARSASCMCTIGRIAYRQDAVFFPTENALSAGKGRGGSA